jgi:hypothetical protein
MPQTGTADPKVFGAERQLGLRDFFPGVFEGGHTSSFEGYGVASALS